MASLSGKIAQADDQTVIISGSWHLIDAPGITSPFKYTSASATDPIRAPLSSDGAGDNLPGSGNYFGGFHMADVSGLTEYKETDLVFNFNKGADGDKITVNGKGKNQFGTFTLTGTIKVSTCSFEGTKAYDLPDAEAPPASPRVGGSGRVRKTKRPYSPPPEPPKAPTAKKTKVEPPASPPTDDLKKEEADTKIKDESNADKPKEAPENDKKKAGKKKGEESESEEETESEEESGEESSSEEESSEEESSEEESSEEESSEESSSEEESSEEGESSSETEPDQEPNAATEVPQKSKEELEAEAAAAEKKRLEEEAERKRFRGKRERFATIDQFTTAQNDEPELKVGVHYLYRHGMEELVSVPKAVLDKEGIEKSLMFGGIRR